MQAKDPTNLSISRYLETVWGFKGWIVLTILVMALVAGGYSLTLADRYQATAQTILLPPLLTAGTRVEPRTVSQETLAQLLRSPEIARRVRERILDDYAAVANAEQADPSRAANLMPGEVEALAACSGQEIDSLSEGALLGALSAEVSIELRMPTEILYSPVVRVRSVLENPRLARVAANAAARVLVDLHAELLRGHAQRSYDEMTRLAGERRKAIDAIDSERDAARKTLGDPEILRREADVLTRAYERAAEAGAPAAEVEPLRHRAEEVCNRLANVEDKLESLRFARDAQISSLANIHYTQDAAAYAPSIHLGELQMASPAGGGPRRVSPNRGRIMTTAAIALFALWLAGAFLLLFVEPSDTAAEPTTPGETDGLGRSRRSRGSRPRSRHGVHRREGDSRRPTGNGPGGSAPRTSGGAREGGSPGVTNIRPE
ncbi:hypothetical protein JW916_00630 [Candidatus Sumerlaeota bacterium]|nr:hypothetical protein [Candidatus Sumerlaeota bacterium]